MTDLTTCLERSATVQGRRSPRQVLGARMGLYAGQLLDVDLPRTDQPLLALVELDDCLAEVVAVRRGARVSGDAGTVAGLGGPAGQRAPGQRRLSGAAQTGSYGRPLGSPAVGWRRSHSSTSSAFRSGGKTG